MLYRANFQESHPYSLTFKDHSGKRHAYSKGSQHTCPLGSQACCLESMLSWGLGGGVGIFPWQQGEGKGTAASCARDLKHLDQDLQLPFFFKKNCF